MIDSSVFILDPQNIPFLRGERRYPQIFMKRRDLGCSTFFLILFLVISAYIISTTVGEIRELILLAQNPAVTQGLVTNREGTAYEGSFTYSLTYTFDVEGVTYTNIEIVSKDLFDAYEPQTPIEILYFSGDPTVSRPKEHQVNMLGIIFSIVWVMLTILLFASLIRIRIKDNRLRRTGKTIQGKIIDIKGEWVSEEGYQVQVEVTLRTPDTGEIITGKRTYTCHHLENQPLSPIGMPVYIFYADKKTWEIL